MTALQKLQQAFKLMAEVITERDETIEEQQQQLNQLWAIQESWVKLKRAIEITGISRSSLLREREEPGTLIRYNTQDKTYEVKSLLAFKRAREKKKADPQRLRQQLRG